MEKIKASELKAKFDTQEDKFLIMFNALDYMQQGVCMTQAECIAMAMGYELNEPNSVCFF